MNNKIGKIIAMDIDGCIAEPLAEEYRHQYWRSIPIKDVITKVNKLYENKYVIIYHTGRDPIHYAETYAWLVKQGCKFHALRMGKLNADWFIDDKNITIDELLKHD